jgi:hydroxymethylpyrimidine pyrophosphatase-like HAD family hydrolase
MRYLALALDYDGTAATDGRLSETAALAIERVRTSGRRVILVTARRIAELRRICSNMASFDLVAAENGAVLYDPHTREEIALATALPPGFVARLQARGVAPIETGTVLVATHATNCGVVLEVIRELGLEVQLIFNRDAVMALPPGINKATGLEAAVRRLGMSRHEVVGIGDAENDHSLLQYCECGVAVANAVASLQQAAAFVTRSNSGAGVAELADELIATDLRRLEGKLEQHLVLAGKRVDGREVRIPPYGRNLLIAGPSGSGKSTATAGLVERLIDQGYQVCIIDPEGDYSTLQAVASLGNQQRAPTVGEVLSILEDPSINLSVNLLGLPLEDRPHFLAQLIPGLQSLRARTGRPHWIVLDEAHHMLPQTWGHASSTFPSKLGETILVTVHPDHVAPAVLAPIDVVLAVGPSPQDPLERFAKATARELPWPDELCYEAGYVIAWFAKDGLAPFQMTPQPARTERIRHLRKYADGNLRQHSFYFRGPQNAHNLKAHNLSIFCQIAEGIDEQTWMFHLRRHDYSRWFRDAVRDRYLADQAENVERRTDLPASQTRFLIRDLVCARYTLPA